MSNMVSYSGGCACGAVRYRARAEPKWVAHCHCRDCRRASGNAFTTYAGFATVQVTMQGPLAVYLSSPDVRRSFCPKCGTPISYDSERWSGEIHLFLCTFDDPAALAPRGHVHTADQVSWLHLADGLPRFRTTPSQGGPET